MRVRIFFLLSKNPQSIPSSKNLQPLKQKKNNHHHFSPPIFFSPKLFSSPFLCLLTTWSPRRVIRNDIEETLCLSLAAADFKEQKILQRWSRSFNFQKRLITFLKVKAIFFFRVQLKDLSQTFGMVSHLNGNRQIASLEYQNNCTYNLR